MISSRITQVLKTLQYSITYKDESEDQLINSDKSWLCFGVQNEYELSIANDRASKEMAYKLVYKTYIEKKYTLEHDSKMWYSLYDAHPDTMTFIVKKYSLVVGAVTVVYDSLLGLPCEEIFYSEVDQFRNKLKYLAEVVSLAVDEKERGASEIIKKMFNTVIRYSQRVKGASDFLITVNPRHSFFYKKKLLFDELSNARSFDKVAGAPAVLLHLDLEAAENIVKDKSLKKYRRTLYSQFVEYELESEIFESLRSTVKSMGEVDFTYFFKKNRKSYLKLNYQDKKYLSEFYTYLKPRQIRLLEAIRNIVS